MNYKIEVHYENRGQLEFILPFDEPEDALQWLESLEDRQYISITSWPKCIMFNMDKVTGILIQPLEDDDATEEDEE